MAAKDSLVLKNIFGGGKNLNNRATAQIPRAGRQGLKRAPRIHSRLSKYCKRLHDVRELLEEINKLLKTLRNILVSLIGLISVTTGLALVVCHYCSGKPASHSVFDPALKFILKSWKD